MTCRTRVAGPAPARRLPLRLESLAAALVSLSMATGCGDVTYPPQPGTRELVVHGMIAGGQTEQEVVLEYTRFVGEGVYRDLTPASGAEINVTGEGSHDFAEDPQRPGVYRGSFAPTPGTRYVLRIRGPNGETVGGETVVPGAPAWLSPGSDTTVVWGSWVSMVWSSAPHAAAYVLVQAAAGEPSAPLALQHPAVMADTAFMTQPGNRGVNLHLRIAAVDSNYVRYVAPQGPDVTGRVRATVEGAYGLFGSYSIGGSRLVAVQFGGSTPP
jgi:hypothetical protein